MDRALGSTNMCRNGRGRRTLHLGSALLGLLIGPAEVSAMSHARRGPAGLVVANDGLSCAGTLIQLGDTQDRVARLCGAPLKATHWVNRWHGKIGVLDMWRYERYGSFPRLLRFEDGVLVSIAAISRLGVRDPASHLACLPNSRQLQYVTAALSPAEHRAGATGTLRAERDCPLGFAHRRAAGCASDNCVRATLN